MKKQKVILNEQSLLNLVNGFESEILSHFELIKLVKSEIDQNNRLLNQNLMVKHVKNVCTDVYRNFTIRVCVYSDINNILDSKGCKIMYSEILPHSIEIVIETSFQIYEQFTNIDMPYGKDFRRENRIFDNRMEA